MQRPTALITSRLPDIVDRTLSESLDVLRLWEAPDREAFLDEHGPDIRGMVTSGGTGADRATIERLPALEIIANFGVGYDAVDTEAAARRGIVVTNTPDVLTEEVADITLGLLISTLRQLPASERYLRQGRWLERPFPLTSGTLRGRTIGILGLGRIGKAVARRIEACDVKVAYHGRSEQAGVPYRYYASLTEMAREVDTLVIVAPGGPETHNIVNAQVLEALGPNGVVINVARGTLIDERALVEALQNGTILSAGLDVFEEEPKVPAELIAMDHVVLLPHVGSASVHTRDAMGKLAADNVVSWFRDGRPLTPVAETPWPR